jgi:hypothetical protein
VQGRAVDYVGPNDIHYRTPANIASCLGACNDIEYLR